MRIGVGGFFHETNTFSNIPFTLKIAQAHGVPKERYFECFNRVEAYMGAFIHEAEAQGVEIEPSFYTSECPSGLIQREALEMARDRIVEGLWQGHQEAPFDALSIHLHGAAVADEYPDADGEILRAVRETFGPDMPIGVVLDLHGNISDQMIENCDLMIGIKCYPHTDEYGAARIMFAKLCEMVREKYRVYKKIIHLPWLMVPAEGLTMSGPAHDVQQLLYKWEEDPEIVQATFFHGFPYSDVEEAGVSVVTMAKTQEAADKSSLDIARYAWSRRHDFRVHANSPEEAMDLALQVPAGEGPVLINESSDNTGGGAPGDGTFLLREMLKRNLPNTAMGYIYDPEVVQQAIASGIGTTISCKLGGKMDNLHGDPIEIENAYVRNISDGVYVNQSEKGGKFTLRLGPAVCLQVGNVSVVVASGRTQAMDDGVFRMVGLSRELLDIVAIKSSQHFKAWWKDRSRAMIPCDPPGVQCADLTGFAFKHAHTEYFPLQDAKWDL